MTTGEKIAKLRKEFNYTQEQFAELMNVSRQSVSKWEQNLVYPDTDKLIRLCSIFHCSIDYILRDEINSKNSIYGEKANYTNGSKFHKEISDATSKVGRKKTEEKYFEGKTPLLKLTNLSKHYIKDNKVKTILHDVNINLYENEFVAITGESGCGKTTLMNMISGSLDYDDGDISLMGKAFSEFGPRDWTNYKTQEIGYVAQDNKLLMQYSVEENVLSGLLVRGYDLSSCYEHVHNILEFVGLTDHKNQKIVNLSAGQRQRVAIARVLAVQPRILLADEVTANLDEETGKNILELLKNLSQNCLVIFITHNFSQVMPYATRHIEIKNKTIAVDEIIPANLYEKTGTGIKTFSNLMVTKKKQLVGQFVKWNLKANLKRGVILTILFVFMGIVLYGLVDVYSMNADDITIKEFDDSAFKNPSDTRIIIKRKDEGLITDKDLECISQIESVVAVEKYDLVNDVCYYYKPEKDHSMYLTYNTCMVNSDVKQFVKSVSVLNDTDIIAGRMPTDFGEIAVSKEDASLLDTEIMVYFKLPFTLGNKNCCQKMKVVAVVDKEDNQVYFSYKDCDMFANLCLPGTVKLLYSYNQEKDYYGALTVTIPIINKNMADDTALIDYQYLASFNREAPVGKCRLLREYYKHYGIEEPMEKTCDITAINDYMSEERYIALSTAIKNEEGVVSNTYPFMEIGYDKFYEIFNYGSTQMSAYITDYLDTDKVLDAINEMDDYDAFSSYRLSMNDINPERKKERTRLYGIILGVLIMMLITTSFLVSSFFGLSGQDYLVYRHIGVTKKDRNSILIKQCICYSFISCVLLNLAVVGLKLWDIELLHDALKYLRFKEVCICMGLYILHCVSATIASTIKINSVVKGGIRK